MFRSACLFFICMCVRIVESYRKLSQWKLTLRRAQARAQVWGAVEPVQPSPWCPQWQRLAQSASPGKVVDKGPFCPFPLLPVFWLERTNDGWGLSSHLAPWSNFKSESFWINHRAIIHHHWVACYWTSPTNERNKLDLYLDFSLEVSVIPKWYSNNSQAYTYYRIIWGPYWTLFPFLSFWISQRTQKSAFFFLS